ncbi:MAG: DUF1834 family protein [Sneathiella sp.]|nr:DUF1834 family protein [Sneathiella sp.]
MTVLISDIEAQLISRVKSVFNVNSKSLLRTVDSLPGEFDAKSVSLLALQAPAVYLLWTGGEGDGSSFPSINSHWSFYILTGHHGGHAQRQQGTTQQIGAYEIIQRLIPALHHYDISDVGTLVFEQAENLFTKELFDQGITAYKASFLLPMPLPPITDPGLLGDLETYHSDWAESAENLPMDADGQPVTHITNLYDEI